MRPLSLNALLVSMALLVAPVARAADKTIDQLDPAPVPLPNNGVSILLSILGAEARITNSPGQTFADLLQLYTAGQDTVMGNFSHDPNAGAIPNAAPPCGPAPYQHWNYTASTSSVPGTLFCGSSSPPTPQQLARLWVPSVQPAVVHSTTAPGLFLGLGRASPTPSIITPLGTGRVHISMDANGTTEAASPALATGVNYQIIYGTGAAPANGDTPSCLTAVPATCFVTGAGGSLTGNTQLIPSFHAEGYTETMTPSTAYWVDMLVYSYNANNSIISNVSVFGEEE